MLDTKKEIGRRIAEIRKKNGDSQITCAGKLGIKRSTLAAYESGINAMPDRIKSKFVRIYNISYEFLISGSKMVEEPAPEYKKKDIHSLLVQLEDTPLHHEIRRRVLELLKENTGQKDRIIELLEKLNQK